MSKQPAHRSEAPPPESPIKPGPGDPLAKPPPQPVGIPETNAKLLWCPFTPRAFDPDGDIHNANCCITTQCMLWHADVEAPNSDQPTGWCSMSTLAPGEQPMGFLAANEQPEAKPS